jgi:hypothetical protein
MLARNSDVQPTSVTVIDGSAAATSSAGESADGGAVSWNQSVPGRGHRPRRNVRCGPGPHVPVVPIQTGQAHVGDEHPLLLVGLPLEADAEQLADRAGTTVGAHHVPGVDGLAGVERDPHTAVDLGEAGEAGAELDRDAFGEQGGGPPLRNHQHVRVRDGRRRLVQLIEAELVAAAVGEVGPQCRASCRARVRPVGPAPTITVNSDSVNINSPYED